MGEGNYYVCLAGVVDRPTGRGGGGQNDYDTGRGGTGGGTLRPLTGEHCLDPLIFPLLAGGGVAVLVFVGLVNGAPFPEPFHEPGPAPAPPPFIIIRSSCSTFARRSAFSRLRDSISLERASM